jgi:(R)-2-hydroxyglutarate---pyruvate transhydrogenase
MHRRIFSHTLKQTCLKTRRLAHTNASVFANLNSVTGEDVAHFRSILPPSGVLSTLSPASSTTDEISVYNNDWMGKYKGRSTTILKPKTVHEVSKILKWCHERRIGVVPQSGNTGLVGGSVPLKDELIINLGNMNKVKSFDPVSGWHHKLVYGISPDDSL